MKFKKLMMLAVFLIAILSIGAASAANQTDDSLSVNDDLSVISDDSLEVASEDVLSSSNQTVTPDNFFDYFDNDGNSISDDDLIFEGEFNSPVSHIYISSKNINGQNAVFRNMGLNLADDVTINGLTLISDQYVENEEGALIYATGSNIVLKNLVLNYNCPGGQNVYGIFFNDCHNFELSNSHIDLVGNNQEFYQYALKMIDSTQGKIKDSEINASLPLLDIDYNQEEGLARDLALCIGISGSKDLLIQNNQIHTIVNAFVGQYPTLDTIMVVGSSNVTLSGNNISETDAFTPEGSSNYLYVVDFYTTNDVLIELNNISVTTVGGNEDSGTSYPIQLSGPYSNVIVNRNRLYANSKGPILGVYSQSYFGGTEIIVQNNFINVTGLPTFNNWGLVSGIELQDYVAKIYNNTIYTQAIDGTYEDGKHLYGISYAQNLPTSENNYDIKDNTIYTQGKYGVYLLKAMNSNITNNVVYSSFAEGNDAVYIGEGENNNISDNNIIIDVPENVVTPENFFEFFDEDGNLVNFDYDELIFKGVFDSLVDYIHISSSILIRGNNATLNNMGFYIEADDFTLDNIKMVANKSFEEGLIYLYGMGVTVTNMDIDYRVQDEFAIVINAVETFNLDILNNKIHLESHVSSDENSAMAINLLDCEDVVVDNNIITCELPALSADTRDMDYFMMGLITVTPIKVKAVTNLKFTHNILNSTTNEMKGEFPTIQAAFIVGSTNVLIDSNRIKVLDEISPLGQDIYLYGINFGYDTNLTFSNNDFNIYTRGGKDAAGTAYDLQGIKSDIRVIGNNITSFSNGPNIGIYVTSMEGEGAEEYIANNFINITGLATASGSWALVTGIEIQNGYAKIYNNTIYTYNVGQYNESAYCYGVSYAQWMYGNRTLDIQDNTIVTEGKYTISTVATKDDESTPVLIKNNNLTARELVGNESIQLKGINQTLPDDTENQTSNETDVNVTGEMTISVNNVWINTDNVVTVTIPNATGSVTIVINGKTYTAELIDGIATKTIPASDLNAGENTITVIYSNLENSTTFKVLDGTVTSANILDYFNQNANGTLFDYVPNGVTLDFQGEIKASEIGEFNIYINKAVNMISSTQDALIDLNTTAGDYDGSKPGNRFTIDKQGSRTNVTGITFHNTQVWIYNADYVTLNNISVIVEDQRVGSGVGATSIRQNSSYVTVKNSYFYTRNNGGSSSLVIAWANYCNFDNNTVVAEGNVGNAIYITTYNVGIPAGAIANVYNNVTNNKVRINPMSAPICNGITFSGAHNLIENNTIIYSAGMGITSQNGLTESADNIFRNNNITGGASMEVLPDSMVYNNYISGSLRLLANDIAYNNTVLRGLTIAGDNVKAYNNTITGPIIISGIENSEITNSRITGDISIERYSFNNTLSFNNITGQITIKGTENIVKNNYISSNQQYTIQMTMSYATGNVITGNTIYSSKFIGNDAVNDKNSKNNVFDNFPLTTELTVKIDSITVGQDAVVQIWINKNSTGTVKVKFNNVENPVSMRNGFGTYNIPNLASGTYSVNVIFSGDDVYEAKTVTETFKVSKNDLTLDVDVNVPDRENPSFTVNLAEDVTGTLTVRIDDVDYTQPIENGHATVTVEGLNPGSYNAVITYSGDSKYNSATTDVDFIIKGNPTIDVTVENINVGDTAYINVSADSRIDNVVIDLNGQHTLNLINGKGTLPISNLAYGDYTVKVIFNGSPVLLNKTVNYTFKVSKIDLSQDAITMDNDFKSPQFNIDINDDATGTLTVKVDGNDYAQSVDNGNATVKINDLVPSSYNAIVTYSGDGKYNPISKEFNFIIKIDPTINIEAEDILVGETAYINITTSSEVDNVILTLNDVETVSITDGKGNASVSGLAAGKYTIKVTFEGNDYIFAKEVTANITVSKHEISDEVFAVNENNFSISLPSDATGTFKVKVGNKNYTDEIDQGIASVIVNEKPGTYDVTMTYSGDSKYMNASKTTQWTVPKWESSISANVSDIHVGDEAVFDIEVNDGATGIVEVIINGKKYNGTINNAKIQITVSGLLNGTYDATVNYTGDNNYLSSNVVKTFKVSKVDITGEWFSVAGTITVTLPDDATGNVNLKAGSNDITEAIDKGKAEIVYVLTPGTYTATVTYSGDDKYNGISGNAQISIPKYETPITVKVNDVIIGEDVIFNVVLPSYATGKITVAVNGNIHEGTLADGKATITVADLELGNYTADISYAGDDNYTANQTTAKFSVSRILIPDADQVITIPETSGSNPSYSIDLEGATGNLTVYVDGKVYKTQELVNGKASIDVTGLDSGNHNILVVYSGDGRYASISKETSLHVPAIKLAGSDFTMLYTSGAKYRVRLTSDGVGMIGQTIVFTINGKTVKAVTDKNGYASVTINLPPKTAKYTLTATYNGVKTTNKVKVNGIVTAKNVKVKKSAKTLKIKVTLKKVNGKYLKSKKVTLKFNGKTYKANTNKKGVATFKIPKKVIKKLKAGKKYTYKATYLKQSVSKKVTVKK